METPIIAAVVGVMAIALLLIILRRVVRLAIRLALVGLIVLMLLVGGIVWWWNGGLNKANSPGVKKSSGATQRGNAR